MSEETQSDHHLRRAREERVIAKRLGDDSKAHRHRLLADGHEALAKYALARERGKRG